MKTPAWKCAEPGCEWIGEHFRDHYMLTGHRHHRGVVLDDEGRVVRDSRLDFTAPSPIKPEG